MKKITAALLIIVGVIHLLPLGGVLGPEKLSALYGVHIDGPDLAILMRHRAILFGLLGVFMCYAAFRPALQGVALLGGFVSTASFLWLAWATGGYNAAIGKVVVADIVALACLLVAAATHFIDKRTQALLAANNRMAGSFVK